MASFFNKLSNSLSSSRPEYDEEFDVQEIDENYTDELVQETPDEFANDGELTVDVYKDKNMIVVKAMTPGVKKEDLEIGLSRDTLTIRGFRHDDSEVHADHYHYQELYWGSFSRTVRLPEEVDIDQAEAHENLGLLTIKLPILDKKRQNKLKVKNS